jgi:hypothetical protein
MKKALILLLTGSLIFTGCGQNDTAGDKTTQSTDMLEDTLLQDNASIFQDTLGAHTSPDSIKRLGQ